MKNILLGIVFSYMWCQFLYSQTTSFRFQPDSGIRLDSSTTRKAILKNDTMFLYYGQTLDTNGTPLGLAIAIDTPNFLDFAKVNIDDYPLLYFHTLPNGIYRKYTYDKNLGGVFSESSTDGYHLLRDTGLRYTLDTSDHGSYGVSTYFNDAKGRVHMLYNADRFGAENVRSAVSTDNGWNFSFITNNIFGDLNAPGGNLFSYVDPFAVVMPDQTIRVFVMNRLGISAPPAFPTGYICSFLSTDNGRTFSLEKDNGDSIRLAYDDFPSLINTSLNDPKVVLLADGRIKVYVNGLVQQPDHSFRWEIISATTTITTSIYQHDFAPKIQVFPNPFYKGIMIYLNTKDNQEVTVELYDINGKLTRVESYNTNRVKLNLTNLKQGNYIIKIKDKNGRVIKTQKIIKQ